MGKFKKIGGVFEVLHSNAFLLLLTLENHGVEDRCEKVIPFVFTQ
jgi:hypothetical protein